MNIKTVRLFRYLDKLAASSVAADGSHRWIISTSHINFYRDIFYHFDDNRIDIQLNKELWLSFDFDNHEATMTSLDYKVYKPALSFLELDHHYRVLLGDFYDLVAMLFEVPV